MRGSLLPAHGARTRVIILNLPISRCGFRPGRRQKSKKNHAESSSSRRDLNVSAPAVGRFAIPIDFAAPLYHLSSLNFLLTDFFRVPRRTSCFVLSGGDLEDIPGATYVPGTRSSQWHEAFVFPISSDCGEMATISATKSIRELIGKRVRGNPKK